MTRVSTHDLTAGPPLEGLVKLDQRPAPERSRELAAEWEGHGHLLKFVRPSLSRQWELVAPALQKVLIDLARGERRWPLYLHGGVGVGKTRAALAFCDKVVSPGYWAVDDVMTGICSGCPPWSFNYSLAVLDEVGLPRSGKGRDFDYSAVKEFCDWRECRPAIYICNHHPDAILELYDRRIFSRLMYGTVFELTGPDRRLRS